MKKAIKYTSEPIKARIVKDFLPPAGRLRHKESAVKVSYDTRTDTLTLTFRGGAVRESDEVTPGVIVDRDAAGEILGIELLDASKRGADPKALQFAVS